MRDEAASHTSTLKYGFVRAKSCRLRLTVGSVSICFSATVDVDPVRFGLMISSGLAVTVTVSDTAASFIRTGTSAVVPRPTSTPPTEPGRKPSSVAVILYGPPTRTFGRVYRPNAPDTVE